MMRSTYAPLILATAAIALPAQAQITATRVLVPEHRVWCATSQPVDVTLPTQTAPPAEQEAAQAEADANAKVVHSALFDRIQRNALEAGMVSLGVPYADRIEDLTPPPPPATTPANPPANPATSAPIPPPPTAPVSDPRSSRYRLTVCAAVQPDAPPATNGLGEQKVPARDVYAVNCPVESEAECRAALLARLRVDHVVPAEGQDIDWHVSQALTGEQQDAAIIAALSDYRLRTLKDDAESEEPPLEFAIYWMPVDEARQLGAPERGTQ
jgi:hypothetical protein